MYLSATFNLQKKYRKWIAVFICRLKVHEKYTSFFALPDESQSRITKRNDREVQQSFTETDSYAFTKIVNGERILGTLIENKVSLRNHI